MPDIPKTMSAVVTTGHGGFEMLELRHDYPTPRPGKHEVLIKVSACGMNNTDINTRVGWYDDQVQAISPTDKAERDSARESSGGWGGAVQFPLIQGADICGRVVELGEAVPADLLGKRVINDPWLRDWHDPMDRDKAGYTGSERDGGFAQYVALPAKNIHPVDCAWSDVELATISCSYSTAENMLRRARLAIGETILITGASGGVGSALIQLARLRSATIIALSTAEKAGALKALGADAVIRRGQDDWQGGVRTVTGKDKVDLVADVVGGPVFTKCLNVMKRGARYVTVGAIAGKTVELDLSQLYLKDWELIGATVTSPDIFPSLIRYIENAQLKPLVAKTYPLADIRAAQEDFLRKRHIGNIVLETD